MDHFNILIVDDEIDNIQQYEAMCSAYPEARVFTATTP